MKEAAPCLSRSRLHHLSGYDRHRTHSGGTCAQESVRRAKGVIGRRVSSAARVRAYPDSRHVGRLLSASRIYVRAGTARQCDLLGGTRGISRLEPLVHTHAIGAPRLAAALPAPVRCRSCGSISWDRCSTGSVDSGKRTMTSPSCASGRSAGGNAVDSAKVPRSCVREA